MARTLHEKLLGALQERSVWEERQALYYEMRHLGIARRNKPFKGAADLHLPLADNAVEKLKPYYINSIFGRQRLASFTALQQQLGSATSAAADFLDWQLKNQSNFNLQIAYLVDLMLVSGPPVLKVRWDPKANGGRGGLVFEAIDPMYFIVPPRGDEIDEMDYFCHVQQTTVRKFQRNPRYTADDELLARIRGGAQQVEHWKDQEKAAREGITYSEDEDEIILFEAYERVKEGWRVSTYSPSAPESKVRPDFILDYKLRKEPMQPFVRWRMEITEKGFYAPRGVVEKVAPYETYGTKLWNNKADWMEYCMKPLFTRDPQAAVINTDSIKLRPGDVLPPGVSPATMPEPPFALDAEMNSTRQLAEERAGTPDFGVTEEQGKQDNRTAAEVNMVGTFASQGIQLKAWITAQSEGETYRKAWALLVQFGSKELTYYQADQCKVLPEQALHDNYLIAPDASPDQWNKQQRMQRSIARFQMHKGNPNVNQEELTKSVLEDDDPRLVKRMFLSTGNKAANESEDEAIEITSLLLEGYPAQVNPGEDHVTRLRILFGKLQQLSMMPMPATPEEAARQQIGAQRMKEHVMQHLQALKQENPAMARQFVSAIQAVDPSGQAPGQMGGGMGGTETLSSGAPLATQGQGLDGGLPGVAAGQAAGAPAMMV